MGNQKGFTLIEALTGGLISTLVAGALLSALNFTNRQIKTGTLQLRVDQMQTTVSDQLHLNAHMACGVRTTTEPLSGTNFEDDIFDTKVDFAKEIIFCDKAGNPFARYRISPGLAYLEEWSITLGRYIAFTIAEEDTAYIDQANSYFNLSAFRKDFTSKITFRSKDLSYTVPVIEETILCRNTSQ